MKSVHPHPTLIAVGLLFATPLIAAEVDSTFNPNISGGIVNSVAVSPDGSVLIAGDFSHVNGQLSSRVASLQSDGSLKADFHAPTVNGRVLQILSATDGSIYLAGGFSTVEAATAAGVARLLSNGSLDSSFSANGGINGSVAGIALSDEGNLIAGGTFNRVDADDANFVASFAPGGTLNGEFASGLAPNFSMEAGVSVLAIQADGKILVGGNFNVGDRFEELARLNSDGSIDQTFSGNHGPMLYPKTILPLANGKILVAGMANSNGNGFVRRLNEDGTIDSSFAEASFNSSVEALALDANGRIIAGGQFTTANGQEQNHLTRLSHSGNVDQSWTIGANALVKAITVQTDGKILVGGAFTQIGGRSASGLARLGEGLSFKSMASSSNGFKANLQAELGRTYVIESSTDLNTWTTFKTNMATTAGLEIKDESAALAAKRFFRARVQ